MLKITVEGLLLFLTPFAVYAGLLVLGPRFGFDRRGPMGGRTGLLVCCGVGLVILALLTLGVFGDRSRGTYVPAHMEDGRLVPGRMR